MTDATVTILVAFISGLLLLGGAFITAKYGLRSAKATAEPGWDKFSSTVMTRLIAVEAEADKLRARIDAVEGELRGVNRLLTSALGYIERLLDFITEAFPERRDTPPIPSDLHDHLPQSLVSNWKTQPQPPPAPRAE